MPVWEWEKDSILYQCTPDTPTREIFQAVCDEIGRYYQDKGVKYTRSNRKLKWKGEKIRCEFGFWSSHSNIKGEWVNFEIVTSVYALDLSGMERKGILSFHIKPRNFNVYCISLEQFESIASYIADTLMMLKGWETKEGLEKYIQNLGGRDWTQGNPNNQRYLSSFE